MISAPVYENFSGNKQTPGMASWFASHLLSLEHDVKIVFPQKTFAMSPHATRCWYLQFPVKTGLNRRPEELQNTLRCFLYLVLPCFVSRTPCGRRSSLDHILIKVKAVK